MVEYSSYEMNLYCDGPNAGGGVGAEACPEFRTEQISAVNRASCLRVARKQGWCFKRDGRTICPMCRKAKNRQGRDAG